MGRILPYILYGIQEKYDEKRKEAANSKKGKLERMVKWTEYALKEGAEFTAYRAVPTLGILMGMGAVIADSYKLAAGLFTVSGLIVYADLKRAELI